MLAIALAIHHSISSCSHAPYAHRHIPPPRLLHIPRYLDQIRRERELLKARNLCPAKGDRLGYLLTLTVTSTVTVILWFLAGHWTARALNKRNLPRRGYHHYTVMTGMGLALLWTANDIMADWSTFFIDIWKRRYSRPVIFMLFGMVTGVNSLAHLLRVGSLALVIMRTGLWPGLEWPSGVPVLQGFLLVLLVTDAAQAVLLSVLVSQVWLILMPPLPPFPRHRPGTCALRHKLTIPPNRIIYGGLWMPRVRIRTLILITERTEYFLSRSSCCLAVHHVLHPNSAKFHVYVSLQQCMCVVCKRCIFVFTRVEIGDVSIHKKITKHLKMYVKEQ